jgi:hypothetical protein
MKIRYVRYSNTIRIPMVEAAKGAALPPEINRK